jgi:hypothetical protein
LLALAVLVALTIGGGYWWSRRFITSLPIEPRLLPSAPAELARWPWPRAKSTTLQKGVTQWRVVQGDGTSLDLLEFDFKINPKLRLEIFDQDENDAIAFDNRVKYWPRGAAQVLRELDAKFTRSQRGHVVAIWNGLFFGFKGAPVDDNGEAFHVSPVVLDGKVHFNTANHRWAFGVKYSAQGPQFKMFHQPSRAILEKEYDWGGGSAQCLIKDGSPLKLEPFPRTRGDFKKQPVSSTPQEAGHIPIFDHMHTCRASLGWTRDNKKLYLLVVKEPDNEAGSAVALKRGLPITGGWTVPDVQRFWLSKDVWGAMNSDAGDVAQLVYLRNDGRYEMIPPRWSSNRMRLLLKPDFSNAPHGGSIMYFYVREAI